MQSPLFIRSIQPCPATRLAPVNRCLSALGYVAMLLLPVGVTLLIAPMAMAADDERISRLVRQSGVAAQLQQALPDVRAGLEDHWQSRAGNSKAADCDDGPLSRFELQHYLGQMLRSTTLNQSFARELSRSLSQESVRQSERWFQSEPGRLIATTEAQSGTVDPVRFEQSLSAYLASDAWTPQRRRLVKRMLEKTRSAEFVTIYNTGIVSMTTMATTCRDPLTTDANRALHQSSASALKAAIAQKDALLATYDWTDDFVQLVLLDELVPIAGGIFQSLETETLEAYIVFAGSAAGSEFFDKLLSVTEQLLRQRVALVREYFDQHLETVQSLVDQ